MLFYAAALQTLNYDWDTLGIGVYGGAQDCSSGGCFIPPPPTNVPPAQDWLQHVPEPSVPNTLATIYEVGGDPAGEPALGIHKHTGDWIFHPGLYTGSTGNGQKKIAIQMSGGSIDFYPGIYFLDSGMKISSSTRLRSVGTDGLPGGPGEGVMFYNTTTSDPTSTHSWNEIDIVASTELILNPMTTGTYKGILFFEGRNSPKLNPGHRIAGNLTARFSGVLYFSKGHLDYAGTTATGNWTAIIADTIRVTGNATLSSNFLLDSDQETVFRTAMLVE